MAILVGHVGMMETAVKDMIDREDHLGTQARMVPVMEAYVPLLIAEFERGVPIHELLAGVTSCAAGMIAQVMINAPEGFSEENAGIVRAVFAGCMHHYEDRCEAIRADPHSTVRVPKEAMN